MVSFPTQDLGIPEWEYVGPLVLPCVPIDVIRGVASRLATAIYVAMVTPILYDNFYSPMTQIVKMKVIGLMVDFKSSSIEFFGELQSFPPPPLSTHTHTTHTHTHIHTHTHTYTRSLRFLHICFLVSFIRLLTPCKFDLTMYWFWCIEKSKLFYICAC